MALKNTGGILATVRTPSFLNHDIPIKNTGTTEYSLYPLQNMVALTRWLLTMHSHHSGYFIEFPNAFIPNSNGPSGGYFSNKSDEDSQIFHPVFSGVSHYQLRIFSRTGVMIFEAMMSITAGTDIIKVSCVILEFISGKCVEIS